MSSEFFRTIDTNDRSRFGQSSKDNNQPSTLVKNRRPNSVASNYTGIKVVNDPHH